MTKINTTNYSEFITRELLDHGIQAADLANKLALSNNLISLKQYIEAARQLAFCQMTYNDAKWEFIDRCNLKPREDAYLEVCRKYEWDLPEFDLDRLYDEVKHQPT